MAACDGPIGRAVGRPLGRSLYCGGLRLAERGRRVGEVDRRLRQSKLRQRRKSAAGQGQHAGRLAEPLDEVTAGRLAPQPGVDLGGEAGLKITTFAIVHCFPPIFPAASDREPLSGSRSALSVSFSPPLGEVGSPARSARSARHSPKRAQVVQSRFQCAFANTSLLTTPRGSRPCMIVEHGRDIGGAIAGETFDRSSTASAA